MAKHRHSIGVDFGTTTSLVAERMGNAPASIVPLGKTTNWLPSLAGVSDGGLLLGEAADDLPANLIIRSVKRAITHETNVVNVAGQVLDVTADEVIGELLAEIANRAESAGIPLNNADVRLGCPAMWTGAQRGRLRDLANAAGIPVDDASLVDEPIAAGISWLSHRYLSFGERKRGRLLVFDMGGGTLDIAVLDVVGGPRPEVSVLSALGVDRAGDALDEAIVRDVAEELAGMGFALDTLDRPELAKALLDRAVRRAKLALSTQRTAAVRIDAPYDGLPRITYSRERLENAFDGQMREAEGLVLAALRQARLTQLHHADPSGLRKLAPADLCPDIDFVLLAGGMSRVPLVEQRLGAMFPTAEVHTDTGVGPEEAIVTGLSENTAYERINLHRPGFDFVLEWTDSTGTLQSRTMYPAHTPFYTPTDALTKSDLSYRQTVCARELPARGTGQLRARAVSGEWLQLTIDSRPCDGITVPFGHKDVVLRMQTNGRMQLVDGKGQVLNARVDGWPVIRGRDHSALRIVPEREERSTFIMPWYWDKEYAPPSMR